MNDDFAIDNELRRETLATQTRPLPNYYQVRFMTADGYHEDLRADTKATATFVATTLLRSKSVKNAYVIERTPDGAWVRNW